MKIINAFWEEQNLGLKSCEVYFEKGERIGVFNQADLEKSYKYIVVKIPSGEIQLVHELENKGFRFIEDQFIVTMNPIDADKMDDSFLKYFSEMSIKNITEPEDIDIIHSNIAAGMFVNDRISMDPYFSKDKSLKRLQNWISELAMKDKVETYLLMKGDEEAGFFVIDYSGERKMLITFAGLFNKYLNSGIAYFLVYFSMKVAKEKGIRKVEAIFSSNNRNMFNIISKTIRFRVKNSYIVLRKTIIN